MTVEVLTNSCYGSAVIFIFPDRCCGGVGIISFLTIKALLNSIDERAVGVPLLEIKVGVPLSGLMENCY